MTAPYVLPKQASTQPEPSWPQFAAWAIAAVFAEAGLAAAFTPLVVVTAPAAALIIGLVVWKSGFNASAFGLAAGAGTIPLLIAYFNRGGPGEVCHSSASSSSCGQEWSPWPFVTVGLILVVGGATLFGILRRRRPGRQGEQ